MKNIKLRALFSSKQRAAYAAIFGLVLVSFCLFAASPAQAAVGINKTVSFQGKVVNTNGTNVADTSYTFKFRIYTGPSGDTATPCATSCIWEETKNLSTVNGIFQTYLGDTNALPGSVDFNSDNLYLAVVFNGDTEMTPRIRLSAVPYAFNASKLGGLDSSSFVQLSPPSQQTGSINVSGNIATGGTFQGTALDAATANAISIGATNGTSINIGKTAGGSAININGTFTAKPITGYDSLTAFQLQNSTGFNILSVDTFNGQIGIATGASAPQYTLDVNGTAGITGNLHFASGTTRTIDVATSGSGAGFNLSVKGGNAGSGNTNGGNLLLTGGTGSGTGARGAVLIDTPAFTTNTQTACSSNCNISQTYVDNGAAVIVTSTGIGVTISMPNPTNGVAGRIVYVTGSSSTNDFTLEFNGSTANVVDVAMRANTSATLVWNGSAWTAAGASSSTTLQAAYNNTLTSAGGAEIVLNNSATSNGLTIRNSAISPVIGGLFEVQSSIGTNFLSINNGSDANGLADEYATNGGAETRPFTANDWSVIGAGSASPSTTAAYVATGQASAQVNTTASATAGIRNKLSANLASGTTYQLSFTTKLDALSTALSTLNVYYSTDGSTQSTACTTGQTVGAGWTKITCTFTPAASATSSSILFQQGDSVARTFYIDNLSVTLSTATSNPPNVQIGGGIYGGTPTLFTLDRSSSPPVAAGNSVYYGSMYYDTTSGRIQCYQANGWGACGSAPDTFVNLTPEYAGAVLGGAGNGAATGVGTMIAQFCSNQSGVLTLNTALCGAGQALNYYQWTSPQNTQQTYSIYLSYQLPGGFKKFQSNATVQLTARVDNTTNAQVSYQMYRSQGGVLTSCGTETTVTTTANTWQTVGINGNEADSVAAGGCGFDTSSANNFVIFKINMKANSNANAYVGTLSFTITNQ